MMRNENLALAPPYRRVRNVSPELTNAAQQARAAMTPAESVLWEALRGRRFHGLRFRAQHPVETFILDFYCPACKLVVEVDGGVHDAADAREHDALRTAHLQAHKYNVVRVRNEEIFTNLDAVLERIGKAAVPITGNSESKSDVDDAAP